MLPIPHYYTRYKLTELVTRANVDPFIYDILSLIYYNKIGIPLISCEGGYHNSVVGFEPHAYIVIAFYKDKEFIINELSKISHKYSIYRDIIRRHSGMTIQHIFRSLFSFKRLKYKNVYRFDFYLDENDKECSEGLKIEYWMKFKSILNLC